VAAAVAACELLDVAGAAAAGGNWVTPLGGGAAVTGAGSGAAAAVGCPGGCAMGAAAGAGAAPRAGTASRGVVLASGTWADAGLGDAARMDVAIAIVR
jgi:hypothetical protein